MKLEQVRSCDSTCCHEAPRWPDGKESCEFLDSKGCRIMQGFSEAPKLSVTSRGKTGLEVFNSTCRDWPHNSPKGRGTGGCCWQWVA